MDDDVDRAIESYLKRVRKVLPESFETDDLIDDLRTHISDSFHDKLEINPERNRVELIQEILNRLGEPEEIADAYGLREKEQELDRKRNVGTEVLIRLFIAIIVVIICAAIVSYMTEGALEFGFTLAVLLIFVVAEWFVRAWQAGESTPIDILRSDRQS